LRQAARSERALSGRDDGNTGGQKPEAGAEPTEDSGEEAELATKTDGNLAPEATSTLPPPDDDGYVWPEGAETSVETVGLTPTAAETPLPSLDELVKRIPAEVRETLDDLFRVKYVSVKRVLRSSLKS
jgi:hypothetical protein